MRAGFKEFAKCSLQSVGLLDYCSYLYDGHIRDFRLSRYRENARYRRRGSPDGLPLPPSRLIWSVIGTTDIQLFFDSGYSQYHQLILPLLGRQGRAISSFRSILDFGCGCGRLTRFFYSLENTRIVGVDYNRALVDWCREHLPFGTFYRNSLEPPLPFEDDSFDLILARSIFTHMGRDLQDRWFSELHRVLAPQGMFVFTVSGDNFLHRMTAEEQLQFTRGNLVVRDELYQGNNSCAAYHPPEYLSRILPVLGFRILDRVPGDSVEYAHQDTYLTGKR